MSGAVSPSGLNGPGEVGLPEIELARNDVDLAFDCSARDGVEVGSDSSALPSSGFSSIAESFSLSASSLVASGAASAAASTTSSLVSSLTVSEVFLSFFFLRCST